jgi:hypothetical protein
MKIRIEETTEVKDLTIIDRKSNCEWTADLVEAGRLKRDDDDNTIMTADDFDWWSEYISDHEVTEDEAEKLAEELEDAGVECSASNLSYIMAKIQNVTDNDYDTHRQAAINAMEEIREEFLSGENE